MERTSLPPGFRFHPTDVELVMYYLKRKVMGMKLLVDAMAELNIYKYSPWDLPDKSCLRSKDLEWYFFCPKERKYASGARTNRATEIGYWKSTGKDRPVLYKQQNVGMVKTLVFHKGHAPSGERTDWVMYEYRLQIKELADAGVVQDAYVLCKVFQKNGRGPQNGAQYGAPFNEEDWNDDAEIRAESLPSSSLCPPALPSNKNDSVVTTMLVHGSTSVDPLSEQGQLNVQPLADGVPSPAPDNDEYMNSLLNMFRDDEVDNCNDIYKGLGDLDWADLIGGECGTTNYGGTNPVLMGNGMAPNTDGTTKYGTNPVLMGRDMAPNTDETTKYGTNPVLMGNDVAFLELNDLSYPLHYPVEATASEHFSDRSYEPYRDNYPKQSCFPVDSFGAFHHVSDMNQLPMLPEEANGHSNHLDLFQEYDPWENANQGFTASSYNLPSTPCEQPREGNTVVQDQNREVYDTGC
ncbi:NAC domain-containing protein 82-like isoform X2 [Diospyros lotus]|uniref:NAC domain-containing protein 82-like isoform X2 n=1 Tax=Diospyros lotus TaxID=55363 RepID=UPI002256C758|nr:NAC domain-containing protein 82-like isoform X2 [Diospyros lotus]